MKIFKCSVVPLPVCWCSPTFSLVNPAPGDQDDLHDVVEIFATGSAFAAMRLDGSIVTWGHRHWGGDSSAVCDLLRPQNRARSRADANMEELKQPRS